MVRATDLESIAAQRLVTDQSASELAPMLTVDQRAIVSLLATAELHGLDAATLLRGYVDETGSINIEAMALAIDRGLHPLDAAIHHKAALPYVCRVALTSSRASGTLRSFYQSWLSQTIDERTGSVPHEKTGAAKLGRALWRTLICIWMLSFLISIVVPEFVKMFEEFGIEWTGSFSLFVWIADWLVRSMVLPIVVLIAFWVFIHKLFFNRSSISDYFRRWFPSRWRQTVLPEKILTRKLLAWDLLAFRGRGDSENQIDWDQLVAQRSISPHEMEIAKDASSLETQAWLLRNMADQKHARQRSRMSYGIELFVLLLQLSFAALTILAALSIFSMLLEIMNGLSGGPV